MIGLDSASIEFGLKALLTLFVVIDPAGLVPVFVSLAGGRSANVQATIARRAVLIAGAVLLLFSVIGGPALAYLGISVAALRVAGGILLFRIAVDMVFAQFRRETTEEEAEARAKEDISVFPLAIPLIAGPGALASILILTSEARGQPTDFALVLVAAAIVLIVAYVFLRASARLAHLRGTHRIARNDQNSLAEGPADLGPSACSAAAAKLRSLGIAVTDAGMVPASARANAGTQASIVLMELETRIPRLA